MKVTKAVLLRGGIEKKSSDFEEMGRAKSESIDRGTDERSEQDIEESRLIQVNLEKKEANLKLQQSEIEETYTHTSEDIVLKELALREDLEGEGEQEQEQEQEKDLECNI